MILVTVVLVIPASISMTEETINQDGNLKRSGKRSKNKERKENSKMMKRIMPKKSRSFAIVGIMCRCQLVVAVIYANAVE